MATFQIPTNPPYFVGQQFNPSFTQSTTGITATVNDLKQYFLSYPNAQGRESLQDTNIFGDLLLTSTSSFTTDVPITIDGSSNYIEFGDATKQYTAFIEANYAQLNTDNIFLSPYQNTFQGSNSTKSTNAPIKFSNITSGEYGTLYVDPSPNNDITLYSNQSSNAGLTVRNPSYSFTVNPTVGNVASFINPISSSYSITGASLTASGTNPILIVNGGSSTTNFIQLTQESSNSVFRNSYWNAVGGGYIFQLKNTSSSYASYFSISTTGVGVNGNVNASGSVQGNNLVVSPSGNDSYNIYSANGFGLVMANQSSGLGTMTLSNGSTTYVTLTCPTANTLQIGGGGGGNLSCSAINGSQLTLTSGANSTVLTTTSTGLNVNDPVNIAGSLNLYESGTSSIQISQEGGNSVLRNSYWTTSGGGYIFQLKNTSSSYASYFAITPTGTNVLVGNLTVPALGAYPQANSNTAATITYVNQAINSFINPTTGFTITQTNVTSFTYPNGSGTTIYSYANANTAYQPTCTLTVNSLGQKKITWQTLQVSSGFTSFTFPYSISQPQYTINGTLTQTPTKIVLAYFNISNYYNSYNWATTANCTQNYTYSTQGGGAFSQATNFQTEIIAAATSPITYYLVFSLNTWSGNGGQASNFNALSTYYVTGQTMNWW